MHKAFVKMIYDELCETYGRQRAMKLLHRTVLRESKNLGYPTRNP